MKSYIGLDESFNLDQFLPLPLIGVDEVGRGCLAGPVYAAAVILINTESVHLLTDSKKLTPSQRENLFNLILEHHLVGLGFATVEEVDRVNILQASFLAMKRAILDLMQKPKTQNYFMEQQLPLSTGHVLVDGHQKIPSLMGYQQTPIVKGDLRVAAISAASIVAKVTRDRFMTELDQQTGYQYSFAEHKGYSTVLHKQRIEQFGPSSWHRKTFAGVKEHLHRMDVHF